MLWTDSTFQWPRFSSSRRRASAVSGAAGDAEGVFDGGLAGLLGGGGALDEEGLADVREGQVAVEAGGGPDGAAFDAPVFEGGGLAEVGLAAVLEEHPEVVEEGGLVALGGEHEVGAAGVEEVGELALGEQGVGGEGAAAEVEPQVLEQGDDGADFVGTFGLVVGADREAVDFFWVWVTPLRWPTAPRMWTWYWFPPILPAAGSASSASSPSPFPARASASASAFVDGVAHGLAVDGDGVSASPLAAWKRCRARSSWSGPTRTRTSRMTNSLGTS